MAAAAAAPLSVFRNFFILSLIACVLLHASGGMDGGGLRDELRKGVLGSRPPACVNKCRSCRPCEASLVIPRHRDVIGKPESWMRERREDDSYYLLAWRCRCGTKLYHP